MQVEVGAQNWALLASIVATCKMSDVNPGSSLTDGLMGHWTFDGPDINWTSATAGTALDRSGQGNNGTLVNMNQRTSPAIGKLGQALEFISGNDTRITVSNTGGLTDIWDGGGSISFWTNPASSGTAHGRYMSGSGRTSISRRSNSGEFTGFWLNAAFTTADGVWRHEDAGIKLNEWNHVVLRYNSDSTANNPELHVNAESQSLTKITAPEGTRVSEQIARYIGNNAAFSRGFEGKIDDVRVYSRLLTNEEIKWLYLMGR